MVYAVAAMVGGVFYREFTRWNGFTGETMLSKVHGHLFGLGVLVFLIVALYAKHTDLQRHKSFRIFRITYHSGLSLTAVMMVVRGVPEVLGIPLSKGMDAAISGMAGIGHILLGVGMISLLLTLKKTAENN